ncbi:hypothetical protein L1987_12020 [Smallanthus sonchifolius]|uniref:Uncharacterized protein n=1 Tax=Smallanthus sonchifolius TaxID=185202 RepID=A0ACB9JG06_9ASTR|nr:hypothetical protein L1987_12020 [Smallanthus sonchifolius]
MNNFLSLTPPPRRNILPLLLLLPLLITAASSTKSPESYLHHPRHHHDQHCATTTATTNCFQFRFLPLRPPLPPLPSQHLQPPPPEEIDPRYGVAKRLKTECYGIDGSSKKHVDLEAAKTRMEVAKIDDGK